jgi:hypothetical protein
MNLSQEVFTFRDAWIRIDLAHLDPDRHLQVESGSSNLELVKNDFGQIKIWFTFVSTVRYGMFKEHLL